MSRGNSGKSLTPRVSVPVNSDAIHELITETHENDMIFYEYEIVDREKEQKWARKQARKYGLCLCSRWLFLLVGNAILVTLICSICAIIIYVNTPIDLTYQPLSFGRSCSTGSTNCDSLRNLVCTSNVCSCFSNYIWNGTDCACGTQQYWDGLACMTNQGYQQPCSTSLPCYSFLFTCDSKTNSCLCVSWTSVATVWTSGRYSQYYTGSVTDLYTGTCVAKQTYQANCIVNGVSSCQEWLGLTCGVGPGNYLQCICKTGYYWHAANKICTAILNGYSDCSGDLVYACNSTAGLYCKTPGNTCSCDENYYYYDTVTKTCKIKGGFRATCACPTISTSNSQCNTTLNLACLVATACPFPAAGTVYTTSACSCSPYVPSSIFNTCDCKDATYYWDGQMCSPKVGLGYPCIETYSCITGLGLTCQYGYCLGAPVG